MALVSNNTIFGGDKGWLASDWTASDDRVRGGKSQSYLDFNGTTATFHGSLDIETLGGAGFASQRTTGEDRHWDFVGWNAIELLVDPTKSDSKQYAFIVKDEILPPNPKNGREQSTTSWEFEFEAFVPSYRGREQDPGRPLALNDIRRISIMMRSYFGTQKGDFRLCISSVRVVNVDKEFHHNHHPKRADSSDLDSVQSIKDRQQDSVPSGPPGLWQRLLSMCNKL